MVKIINGVQSVWPQCGHVRTLCEGFHVKGDMMCGSRSSGLKIEHTWQRILDQTWVIGIVAENESAQ